MIHNLNGTARWKDIQQLVRAGDIKKYYSVGDQFIVNYNNTAMLWDIVAIDVATPADTSKTHSLTLMPHNMFYDTRVFDEAEPNNPNFDRRFYGNNRYAHSAIRQWLNSSANAGSWWTAQHECDAAPRYATTVDGFMKGFDDDFLAVLGLTKFKVTKNIVTDGGGYEELTDTFYLPSKMEVGLGAENSIEEGTQFPYFTDNASRIKYREGTSDIYYWWLRTPHFGGSNFMRYVNMLGTLDDYICFIASGVVPACNII